MPKREDYARRPRDQRLDRLARTPDDLNTLLSGRGPADIARRPDAKSWSATEIICHLRDIEEFCMLRFRMMLAMEAPKVLVAGARVPNPAEWGLVGAELAVDPERWAEERQYRRSDAGEAVAAFQRRRRD